MKVLPLDITNILILFKPDHILHRKCFAIVEGHQWFIWFMTHSELIPVAQSEPVGFKKARGTDGPHQSVHNAIA